MLKLELVEAQDLIQQSLDAGRWLAAPDRVLSNEKWCEHRNKFSAAAQEAPWRTVSTAFLRIAEVRRAAQLDVAPGDALDPQSAGGRGVTAVLEPVGAAIDVLAQFLRLPRRMSHRRADS